MGGSNIHGEINKLNSIIRILAGTVFLLSSFSKIFDLKNTISFFSQLLSISVTAAIMLFFVVTIIELFISFLLFNLKIKLGNSYKYIIIYLVILSIVTGYFYLNGFQNCGCFGTKFILSPNLTVVKNALIIFLILLIYRNEKRKTS